MANLLKMAVSETIHALHRRGWSQRRIADELGHFSLISTAMSCDLTLALTRLASRPTALG